ncbi:MAG: hypothetical protein SCH70_13055 [Candidatus Methanoperedens sp.]|nr:hypothetical protein [Candidatus Methanoperedens sp.]
MEESSFVSIFENISKNISDKTLIVKRKANLFYEIYLDTNLKVRNDEFSNPKRGNSAFQTDICIFERKDSVEIPRIAIEFKTRLTTHDVLTYSAKAGKHKNIYHYLRYGLIASDLNYIPGRFFTHNDHIDFIIAANNYKDREKLSNLIDILIKRELEISKTLEQIQFENKKYDYFQSNIIFKNFEDS